MAETNHRKTSEQKRRYRSCRQSVANLLLGKDAPVLPIVDMKEAQKTIAVN